MRSSFAVASLITGIFCFITLLGAEKAILAIIFGMLAFREIRKEEMTGKSLAIIGIILALAYIVVLIVLLPYLNQILPNLAMQNK